MSNPFSTNTETSDLSKEKKSTPILYCFFSKKQNIFLMPILITQKSQFYAKSIYCPGILLAILSFLIFLVLLCIWSYSYESPWKMQEN